MRAVGFWHIISTATKVYWGAVDGEEDLESHSAESRIYSKERRKWGVNCELCGSESLELQLWIAADMYQLDRCSGSVIQESSRFTLIDGQIPLIVFDLQYAYVWDVTDLLGDLRAYNVVK